MDLRKLEDIATRNRDKNQSKKEAREIIVSLDTITTHSIHKVNT